MKITFKYPVIKSREQYDQYCDILENLVFSQNKDSETQQEIELLTLLIEHWDSEHSNNNELDPIELLKALMNEHKMRNKALAEVLEVSPGLISDILNHKKGLSKENIWKLADYFKISQESLNKPFNKPQKVEFESA